jgi:hypothetical protein
MTGFATGIICDVGNRTIGVGGVIDVLPGVPNREGNMSLLYHSNKKADLKRTDYTDRTDYGFILALVCMALALVVASVIFTPAPVGAGITSEITSVSP